MSATLACEPKALLDALAAVKPAVNTRSAVGALSCVQIVGIGDRANVIATDHDVAVRRALIADTNGLLDVLVDHAHLQTAVKRFAKRPRVELRSEDGGGVTVRDDQRSITLRAGRREDWPSTDFDFGAACLHAPNGRELAKIIERASVFASKDETRPVLTGLVLDLTDVRSPSLVATDSYRLGQFALHATVWNHEQVNLPARGLKMAAKSMTGEVTIKCDTRFAVVHTELEDWRLRRIEGKFPDHRDLWPEASDMRIDVPVPELREACETAVAFCLRNAPMRFQFNGGVQVTGGSPDGPQFSEQLAGARYLTNGHENMEYGINPDFMRDIAKVARNGSLELGVRNPLRPMTVLDGADRYLIMPIRLNV